VASFLLQFESEVENHKSKLSATGFLVVTQDAGTELDLNESELADAPVQLILVLLVYSSPAVNPIDVHDFVICLFTMICSYSILTL
jgi:hypothetical protein